MVSLSQIRRRISGRLSSSATSFEEGRVAFKAGDYARSEAHFLEALRSGADEASCRLHLARIYNRNADWTRALEHWAWLRDRGRDQVEPHLQVGRANLRLLRHVEAIAAFEAVLSLAPGHAEAQEGLRQAEAQRREAEATVTSQVALERRNLVARLLDEGRLAFKAEDDTRSEASFLAALQAGADEAVCHLHLARIYNRNADWAKALEHWVWLRDQGPDQMEPHLQIARARMRLGQHDEAASSFEAVLELSPEHPEAQQALSQIQLLRNDALEGLDRGESWLALMPESLRWRTSANLLDISLDALETSIGRIIRQTDALSRFIGAFGSASGQLGAQRQLYELQAMARVEELSAQLASAKRVARALARRTEKMSDSLGVLASQSADAAPPEAPPASRSLWRDALIKVATDIHATHGVDAALAWLYRETPVDDRASVLAGLGKALQTNDRNAAIRLYWLAFGEKPTAVMAEQMASRMFQSGDLSNSSALLEAAPPTASSPFTEEVRSSAALFRRGVAIAAPAEAIVGGPGRLAYVASGSLPFQAVGYTIRTHQLLTALSEAGIDCACFTRPGYPWDRPRVMLPGIEVQTANTIGKVRYFHTAMPEVANKGGFLVREMSNALEKHFRQFGCNIVQAASNSRNALPALIAARRVGAKFIYEVRGLWELTAASRFSGWEETERYKLDRGLEVSIAAHADHVLTITGGVAAELGKDGVSNDRLSLLPNAVDPAAFMPIPKNRELMEQLGLQDQDFVAVYGGSLTVYEGLDDLIVAVAILGQSGVSAKLIIVGDGEVRQRLEQVAVDHRVTDRVTFIGRVNPEAMHGYLSLADVVAIPRKPFKVCEVVSPLKPFEAMSMGKVVVLSDLPALREIVIDGETGLICKPADPVDLAAVLGRLANDTELRDRLGQAGREWVMTHRSWTKNAARLVELYRSLTGAAFETVPGQDRP